MPDPAQTPEEIEDVLASIRRLVSDNASGTGASARAASAARAAGKATATAAPPTEALVLTPSFRVADPDDPWAPVSEAAIDTVAGNPIDDAAASPMPDAQSADPAPADQGAQWTPDDRLAHFDVVGSDEGDATMAAAHDAMPAIADPVDTFDILDPDATPSDEDLADLMSLDGVEDGAQEFESETGDENWPGDGAEAALLTLVARRDPIPAVRHADDEDPVAPDALAEAEAEAAPGDAPPEDLAEITPPHQDADSAEGVTQASDPAPDGIAADDIPDTPDASAPEGSGDAPDGQADPADDPHAPDATVYVQDDTAEPVLPVFSRHAAHATAAADTLNAEGSMQADAFITDTDMDDDDTPIATDVDDLGASPSPFSFPDPVDGILDEDTLREIIVDVVRQELQGVLGQRITRNVRKMVRREIRLALAAEDLD